MRTFYFALWFLRSSFFPRLFSAIRDWMSTILQFCAWCGLSANLECRSEMCCTWLAENTGCKKIAKNSPSAHHCTTLSGCIFATKACIDNRKNFLNSNISSTCSHNMVNFCPLAAEISLPVWGTRANFNGFRLLALLLHRRHWTEVNQTLHDVW